MSVLRTAFESMARYKSRRKRAAKVPGGRTADTRTNAGSKVIAMPKLGGLHHRYNLAA